MVFFGMTWHGTVCLTIPFTNVKMLECSDFLHVIPDGIFVLTDSHQIQLDGFSNRNEAFRLIRDLWLSATGISAAKVSVAVLFFSNV
jgi:hypothetical protein